MPGPSGTMNSIPHDQRTARALVAPLARLGVTPNQVSAFTLLLALVAAGLFALGGGRSGFARSELEEKRTAARWCAVR